MVLWHRTVDDLSLSLRSSGLCRVFVDGPGSAMGCWCGCRRGPLPRTRRLNLPTVARSSSVACSKRNAHAAIHPPQQSTQTETHRQTGQASAFTICRLVASSVTVAGAPTECQRCSALVKGPSALLCPAQPCPALPCPRCPACLRSLGSDHLQSLPCVAA